MNKTLLIIKREFLSRVRKKAFLIATLLTPILFMSIFAVIIYVAVNEEKNAKQRTIQVLDENGYFDLKESSKYKFVKIQQDLSTAKDSFNVSDDYALLHIPKIDLDAPDGVTIFSKKKLSIALKEDIERKVEKNLRDIKIRQSGISEETLKKLDPKISLNQINMSDTGEEKSSNAEIIFGIGYAAGFLIYLFIFIYGAQVMQGVIEEKSSKIVEVIVSTVKPFQLMLGKVVGVASVGLTQFLIWVILSVTVFTVGATYLGFDMGGAQAVEQIAQNSPNAEVAAELASNSNIQEKFSSFFEIPFAYIIGCFIFYFIGGYLLYGALFAAVGSAVDTPADAQQFMMPITIPLIIAIIGLTAFVLRDPDSNASFWLSIIPFTSPIAMMGRIAFEPPIWQVALSMALLVLGFIFTIWFAGRIYRVGILMHGTKVNYKVLAKWFMMKN
ncbi:MAG: ABC transporter permease [Bacteroidota bacterium]